MTSEGFAEPAVESDSRQVVEGADAGLFAQRFEPVDGATVEAPPVLLLHGFASSTELNWERTGWVRDFTRAGRTVLSVDLPAHGRSGPDSFAACQPSRIRADIVQFLAQEGVRPLPGAGADIETDASAGVDVVGYSFGARLAWELGASQPELIRRLVLGGATEKDRFVDVDLEGARANIASGADVAHESTAMFLAMAKHAGNRMDAIVTFIDAARSEPYHPETLVPRQPTLLVAGDDDPLAANMGVLVDLQREAGVEPKTLWLPGRNHLTAVTSREFKDAALAFLS